MEYQMGSFQQILMGVTCLAAAFFFGSYLHNRPAENAKIDQGVTAQADPINSILAFGQRPSSSLTQAADNNVRRTSVTAEIQAPASSRLPSIDPSELAPRVALNEMQDSSEPDVDRPTMTRKAVVPDFSELASRFRNTPLELAKSASNEPNRNAVHESERVEYSGTFKAPEMVIRQPQDQQSQPDFGQAMDQIEQSVKNEFVRAEPQSDRWRVNRPESVDQFPVAKEPQRKPVAVPRDTIEDVLSRRSADWLKEEQTFATNPPQTQGWNSQQRQQVTEKAAMRNSDILDIEDPGNRFHSVLNEVEEIAPPEPDFGNEYYTPSPQRQDSFPPRQISSRLRPIQSSASPSNWGSQSNVQTQNDKRYEIQPGDTLQSISIRFYGTADYYLEIYKANREVLDRISSSPAGVVIEIPQLNN